MDRTESKFREEMKGSIDAKKTGWTQAQEDQHKTGPGDNESPRVTTA